MPVASASTPADRDAITALLSAALGIAETAPALDARFQQWKYWDPHPLSASGRSRTLQQDGALIAHGCAWPIQLCTTSGTHAAFHLIDWAARRDSPGAGMQILRECSRDMTAVFSIGGSAMTRKILPAFGFKPHNSISFLHRPLHPLQPALRDSPADWKLPARVLRNLYRYLRPSRRLPRDWQVSTVDPAQIPEPLWPVPSPGVAVSRRCSRLLSHVIACPPVRRAACGLLSKSSSPAAAYVFLVQIGDQVRLADYGPCGLDEDSSRMLGLGVYALTAELFPGSAEVLAATSEPAVRSGLIEAGFRISHEEPIKVLRLGKSLDSIDRFRLTLIDWDALCL